MTTVPSPAQLGGRSLERVVYTEEEIRRRVEALAREITEAYGPEDELLVVGLLKGSFIFLADLVRRIELPLQVDFLVAASYGAGMVSSGEVRLLYDPEARLTGRAVVGGRGHRGFRDDAEPHPAAADGARAEEPGALCPASQAAGAARSGATLGRIRGTPPSSWSATAWITGRSCGICRILQACEPRSGAGVRP